MINALLLLPFCSLHLHSLVPLNLFSLMSTRTLGTPRGMPSSGFLPQTTKRILTNGVVRGIAWFLLPGILVVPESNTTPSGTKIMMGSNGLATMAYPKTITKIILTGKHPMATFRSLWMGFQTVMAIHTSMSSITKTPAIAGWHVTDSLVITTKQTFDDMLNLGYHLDIVSSYERNRRQRIASLFSRHWNEKEEYQRWEARHGMTEDSYQEVFDDLVTDRGYTLKYVSAGTIKDDDPRFAALFVKTNDDPSFRAYHGESTWNVKDIIDQETSLGYIPAVIDAYQLQNGGLRWVLLFVQGRDANEDPEPNGPTYTETQCFDQLVTTFMQDNAIPGVGTAVLKDGEIVYAQGYGVKDTQNRKAFMYTPFRIASISKPVTALTIMRLNQLDDLELTDKVFGSGGILQSFSDNPRPCCPIVDDRLYDVTIEHLLTHTGGWKEELSFDPMFESRMISTALGISGPATCEDTIYYMFGYLLDFTPGEDFGYSNFGYCILGRVIEEVTGQSYQQAVRNLLLDPAGVDQEEMYLGSTLQQHSPDAEAEYFCPGCGLVESVFSSESDQVPLPYGGWSLEAMDSHGGWVASAVQLMKIMAVVHEPHCTEPTVTGNAADVCLFSPESFNDIVDKLSVDDEDETRWYGLGFYVLEENGGFNLWHSGSLDGTETIMVLTNEAYGYAWALLANRRGFDGNIDDLMWEAVGCVENNGDSWPADFQVTSA